MTLQESKNFRDRIRSLEDDTAGETKLEAAKKRSSANPRLLLAGTFLGLIFLGAFLLCTPWAQSSGTWAFIAPGETLFQWSYGWRAILDQLFMATSASCVTGLTVVNPAIDYSFFGQMVLLFCIQLGGLGIMTLGTFLMVLLLGRMRAENETQLMISYGASSIKKAHVLLLQTIRYVLGFEFIGALCLCGRYYFVWDYSLIKSIWFATFHAISAFCNAGISIHEENLLCAANDPIFQMVITILVLAGGLGFLVLSNVFHYKFWRKDLRLRGRITLHSRLVLWATVLLFVIGGCLFTACEWRHVLMDGIQVPLWQSLSVGDWSGAWSTLGVYGKNICCGFSQAAMFRTAGFCFIDLGQTSQPANFVSTLLMLIGGSPGSMAGGMKTTTVIMLFLTMSAMIHGLPEVQLHRRTIPNTIGREAMVIVFFYVLILFVFYFILLLTESELIQQRGDFALFYEITSAFGTVGTSLNATNYLSPFGRGMIALAMFLGRLGPISIAIMMAKHDEVTRVRYPEENITVG